MRSSNTFTARFTTQASILTACDNGFRYIPCHPRLERGNPGTVRVSVCYAVHSAGRGLVISPNAPCMHPVLVLGLARRRDWLEIKRGDRKLDTAGGPVTDRTLDTAGGPVTGPSSREGRREHGENTASV